MDEQVPIPLTERERLRQVRERRGVDQVSIANVLGITPGDYDLYETGDEPIPDDHFPFLSIGLMMDNRFLHFLVGRILPEETPEENIDKNFVGITPGERQRIIEVIREIEQNSGPPLSSFSYQELLASVRPPEYPPPEYPPQGWTFKFPLKPDV